MLWSKNRIPKLLITTVFLWLTLLDEGHSQTCYVSTICSDKTGWIPESSVCSGVTIHSKLDKIESSLRELKTEFSKLQNLQVGIPAGTAAQTTVANNAISGTAAQTTVANNTISDCNKTSFTFPDLKHEYYVQYMGNIPSLTAFTACAWISPLPGRNVALGSFFSYCVVNTTHCNTIFVEFVNKPSYGLEVFFQNVKLKWNNVKITTRTHFCITKSQLNNKVFYYIDGVKGTAKTNSRKIPEGGILILGQDQDAKPVGNMPGKIHQTTDAFGGTIEDFYIWSYAMNKNNVISQFQSSCFCPKKAIVSFNSANSRLTGNATGNFTVGC